MTVKIRNLIIFLSVLAAASCNSLPDSFSARNSNDQGAILHVNSGTRFPETNNQFVRNDKYIRQYDGNGNDISVGYDLRKGNAMVTLTQYVYQSMGKNAAAELENVNRQIKTVYPGAVLVTQKSRDDDTAFSVHEYEKNGKTITITYIFVKKNWFVKLRISMPYSAYRDAEQSIISYIGNMPLPQKAPGS